MKYYHLDKGHRLHEGMVIQNSKQPIVPLAQREFDALFPNGISEWGKAVLTSHFFFQNVEVMSSYPHLSRL